jgi:WXG100 family type VII secretion target
MPNVDVSYEELSGTAARLARGRIDLEDTLGELQRLVGGLVADGFVTDRASSAFQSAYDEFTVGASRAIGGLDGMAQFLRASAEAFARTDDGLAAALRGS